MIRIVRSCSNESPRQPRTFCSDHPLRTLGLAGIFFALSSVAGLSFPIVMLWLCATGAMLFAWTPSFWVLPTLALGESAAAASFGLINSVGNLGGFVGPSVVGYLLSRTNSHRMTNVFLAGSFIMGAVLILAAPRQQVKV